jgi:hypothetical protein
MNKDRRRYQRTYLPVSVRVYSGTRWLSAMAMDISQDGIRFRFEEDDIVLSKRLGLRFSNQTDTFGIKVCWWHGQEVGCAFLDTLDEHRYNKLVLSSISA